MYMYDIIVCVETPVLIFLIQTETIADFISFCVAAMRVWLLLFNLQSNAF